MEIFAPYNFRDVNPYPPSCAVLVPFPPPWVVCHQSALVSDHHLVQATNFPFSLTEVFQFLVQAPPLRRGRVSNLLVQLLLFLASSVTLG
jgi:hypothetical protein